MSTDDLTGIATSREAWRRRVDLDPDRRFLRDEAGDLSFGETDELAARYASVLAGVGVGEGTRVLVGMATSVPRVVLQLAVLRLGAIIVPLQAGLTFAELEYQIRHCRAPILIADDSVLPALAGRLAGLETVQTWVTSDPARPADLGGSQSWLAFSALAGGDVSGWPTLAAYTEFSPAMILYTSGSTGRPKGVLTPDGSLRSVGEGFCAQYGFGPDDTYFLPHTMAHGVGGVKAPWMAIWSGGTLAVAPKFSPSKFWDQVNGFGGTFSTLFPSHLTLLVETAAQAGPWRTSLRTVLTHADHPDFRDRFDGRLGMVWGMTETGSMACGSLLGAEAPRHGYIGAPMPGCTVEIRGGDGRPVPHGETGEIFFHHRHVMLGYLDDPEATAQTLVDGWIRSGDLGLLEPSGELIYLGRLKNMIKRGGENISPEEVENALAALPGVTESLVFGVADRIRTQEVAAVVVVQHDTEPGRIADALADRLVRWKIPRFIRLTADPLPRLGNGKIDRSGIQEGFDPHAAFDREAASSGG